MRDRRRHRLRAAPVEPQPLSEAVVGYRPILIRYFQRRGVDAATNEDLVQEVFRRLYERVRRHAEAEIQHVEAYLMQTASSVWKDHLRRRQRHCDCTHVEFDDGLHARDIDAPDAILECKQTVGRLIDALNALPERTRNIYVLCRIGGMKRPQVAKKLSISVSAVEKHLAKAALHIGDLFGNVE